MVDRVDSSRFPRLAEYVRILPDGLASYPECKAKGSLVLSAFVDLDVSVLDEGLPDLVREALRNPPSPGLWVPGTLSDAVFYAMVDTFYPTEAETMEWTRERTRKTANSKMYRAFARLTRPSAILKIAAAVHGLFQKGTGLRSETTSDGAVLELTHPPFLHGGLNHRSNVPMFEVVLEGAGATHIEVVMETSTSTTAIYRATWT